MTNYNSYRSLNPICTRIRQYSPALQVLDYNIAPDWVP